jgi:hypothetical protein
MKHGVMSSVTALYRSGCQGCYKYLKRDMPYNLFNILTCIHFDSECSAWVICLIFASHEGSFGCETWSPTLTVEHWLRVFKNRVLRKIWG